MYTCKKNKQKRNIGLVILALGIISSYIARYLNSDFGECVKSIGSIGGICRTPIGVNEFGLAGILLVIIGLITVLIYQIKILRNKKLSKKN